MLTDWTAHMASLNSPLKDLRTGAPDVMKSFSAMAQSALNDEALDRKTKEVIALVIGIAIR